MQKRKGISLIVLVITIIVMVILAGAIILTLNNSGIISKASEAVKETNLATVKEVAQLAWAEAYADGARTQKDLEDAVMGALEDIKVDTTKYTITVTERGVDVVLNSKDTNSSSEITWTKTSEGDLAIGSTVKHIATNEEFYVIGGDTAGTPINSSTEKVILLAKNNLKVDGSAQDPTGAENSCAFSTVENLNFTEGENLNNNSTVKADTTSAVYKAMKYGEILGVTTGRIMLKSEVEVLQSENSDILWGNSSSEYVSYWLSTVWDHYTSELSCVWGSGSALEVCALTYNNELNAGVRPIVEVLKSNIS